MISKYKVGDVVKVSRDIFTPQGGIVPDTVYGLIVRIEHSRFGMNQAAVEVYQIKLYDNFGIPWGRDTYWIFGPHLAKPADNSIEFLIRMAQ